VNKIDYKAPTSMIPVQTLTSMLANKGPKRINPNNSFDMTKKVYDNNRKDEWTQSEELFYKMYKKIIK